MFECPPSAPVKQGKHFSFLPCMFGFSRGVPMQVVGPLLHERDMYLAWSLKRSKAVNGTKRVVGVIGKGHMRGVLYHLTSPEASRGLRFRDLVGGKNVRQNRQQQTARVLKRLALEASGAIIFYLAWMKLFPASGSQPCTPSVVLQSHMVAFGGWSREISNILGGSCACL